MKSLDRLWILVLVASAVFIWIRDRRWMAEADDVLPALAALPLAHWLGRPWRLSPPSRTSKTSSSRSLLVASSIAGVLGLALNVTLLLALAWSGFLWWWLGPRLEPGARQVAARLMVLPFNAFPWVSLDLQAVGWWFRLTGAVAIELLFSGLGFQITRDGTHLVIQGMPISVDASCGGLHALQALLIAGSFLAFILLGTSRNYWWNIALLPAIAWCANTLRIAAITAAALTWGQEFAMGLFHTWGGLVVLVTMFAACGTLFQWQANRSNLHPPRPPTC